MIGRKIFIASSSESKEIARKVAQELASSGYTPLRWWNEFPPGSITLERLLQISREVDGAVFIFKGEDKAWYRGEGIMLPRDNVILEYGIFVSQLDREHALIIKDERAKLPTDISAITYENLIADEATVIEKIVQRFNHLFGDALPPDLREIMQVIDPQVTNSQFGKQHQPWFNKNLYVGLEGAQRWIDVVSDPMYWPDLQEHEIRSMLLDAVDHLEARTFVSFGPGDAKMDKEITVRLLLRDPQLEYIPVDISDALLQHAVVALSDQVRVPIGIQGDFEERINFIFSQLRSYASHPILYGLLGNTFGNMDNYEKTFIGRMRTYMTNKQDHLLMDVSLASETWELTKDPRGTPAQYGNAYRRFLAAGVASQTREPIDQVYSEFESRIKISQGSSDVPHTKTIVIKDSKTNKRIFSIRRYDYNALLKWIETQGFEIVFSKFCFEPEGVIGDAILLLKRS